MDRLEPDTIRSLRRNLDWSADELGAFLGRTRATVYAWENKDGHDPGPVVSGVLYSLWRESERRRDNDTAAAFRTWSDELKEKNVGDFLADLQGRNGRTGAQSRSDGVRGGGPSRASSLDPGSQVYLVPVPREWWDRLTGHTGEDAGERAAEPAELDVLLESVRKRLTELH